MEVIFGANRLARCYEQSSLAVRQWGEPVARKYIARINELYSVPTFDELFNIRSLRVHPQKGNREGQFALALTGRWRLIVARGPKDDEVTVEEVNNHYDD